VTHHPSRKQFFAHFFGIAAAVAVVPKLLARPFTSVSRASDVTRPSEKLPITVRNDKRAVARRDDSI
jgi:hypothetical protein